jgi:poly(hydroxyalkanoate) granule-associated protein
MNQKDDASLLKQFTDSPRQIWLAGLGAFAKMEQEGNRLFDTLVKEGEAFEARTQQQTNEQLATAKNQAQTQLESSKEHVNSTWNLMEKCFEEQVARTLNRLGIPAQNDLQALSDRIDALSASVHQLLAAEAARVAEAEAKAAKNETVIEH